MTWTGRYPPRSRLCSPSAREKLRQVVARRGPCGLANDTKWDELIAGVRGRTQWRPSDRFKCVDGPVSGWDVEWSYHLPFPLLSVEWLDVAHLQTVREGGQVPRVVDHAGWIEGCCGLPGWSSGRGPR